MLKELLINLARSSISDALEHTMTIDKAKLFEEYPDFEKPDMKLIQLRRKE